MSPVNSTEGAGPEGSAAGSNLRGLLGGVNFDRGKGRVRKGTDYWAGTAG